MSYTKKDLAAEASRELQKRKAHYPRFIREGKLSQVSADRQEALMHAIYQVIVALPDDFIHKAQQ